MSITSPTTTGTTSTHDDRNDAYRPAIRTTPHTSWRETKPSPKTTELWLTVVGVVLLAVVYSASRDASLNLFRACTLATILGAAYIVSRGFAKAGSHDDDVRTDGNDR